MPVLLRVYSLAALLLCSMSVVADPTFVPTVRVSRVLEGEDSVQFMELSAVYVYPKLEFKNKKQEVAYQRLVKNVKTVLPIAKEANKLIIETYEVLRDLPKDERDAHIKLVEKEILRTYKPRMRKLTYTQGKLLIKLVYRECNSSTYTLLKAFIGPIKAGMWQAFASIFGANLNKDYDPEGEDALTERIVLMVESGQI